MTVKAPVFFSWVRLLMFLRVIVAASDVGKKAKFHVMQHYLLPEFLGICSTSSELTAYLVFCGESVTILKVTWSPAVSDNDVRNIVLSYLVHNCFKETAETFITCSGMKQPADYPVDMDKRKPIFHFAVEGNSLKAIELTEQLAHDLLEKNKDLHFDLLSLHFVELVSSRKCTEALEFAQTKLTPFGNEDKYVEKLEDRMALLAYEEPEKSPMFHLLSSDYRQSVADKLNRAILAHANLPSHPSMERLIQQLTVVTQCLHQELGKYAKQEKIIVENCVHSLQRLAMAPRAMTECACSSTEERAKAKLEEINKLYDNGSFEKVTIAPLPLDVEIYRAWQIDGQTSAKMTMKKILNALKGEKIRAIRVYGMGGVGKTTIVGNVNNHLKGTLYFSRVIMLVASKELDLIKRMQSDIAKRLGLYLDEKKTISRRAAELMKRLMQEERFLIIFDDLRNRIEVGDVGIPSFEHHNGFKAIFTSRSEDVCREMEASFGIQGQLLSEDKSCKLFKQKVGDIVEAPTVQGVAKKLADECRGLPLALVTGGEALNDQKSVRIWNNALSEMKKAAPASITGMEKEVYRSLKLSFDDLQSEELKLFPEDYKIDVDHVIRYWMGEGFIEGAETSEEVLNGGYSLIEKLKAACLLLDCDKEGYVMMA
ncbi:hypothetical protein ACLOJK_031760 [Asimina triloba]